MADCATYIDPTDLPEFLRLSPERVEKIIDRKTRLIKEYFDKYNLSKTVIGLSGGIDSAVACALAVRALEPENVIVLRLPCGEVGESVRIATEVADRLGIPGENQYTVDIAAPVEAAWQAAAAVFGERGDTQLQRGNMAARQRMVVLEHACNLFHGILFGTENRTEHQLAYFTIGGDNISGIEPLLDLYKTQVYQLAAVLDLPESVCRRQPTAELWSDQTDEGELGVPYVTIDTVLCGVLERGLTAADLERDHDIKPADAERVLDRVRACEGKRNAPYLVQ